MIFYRKVLLDDIQKIALIHEKAFAGFFLTELGIEFLWTYYKSVLISDFSIAVCAENREGEILGFATGSKNSIGYNRKLLQKNGFLFFCQALRLLFLKPQAIIRILKNFEKKVHPKDDGEYAELLSIAVLPTAKGFGVGKGLLKEFEDIARVCGCKKLALTTDYYDNESVIGFYKKCGYSIFYEFTTYPNRKMYKMIKDLVAKK